MILKDFKQLIIEYGRQQLPLNLLHFIRIPGSAESTKISLVNTKKKDVLSIVKKYFGQDSISTNVSNNYDIKDCKPLRSFEIPITRNLENISVVFPGEDINRLLATEKENLAYNIGQALEEKRTSIYRLIEKLKAENLITNVDPSVHRQSRLELWDRFLSTWPIERLKRMTIDEYTNLNRSDSFCYWLESITEQLGSIWGGSAYKFGIYLKKDKTPDTRRAYKTDGTYAWVAKFGENANDAFANVRKYVLQVAEAASSNRLEIIDNVDLGHSFRWKIAALYSKQIPLIYDHRITYFLVSFKDLDNVDEKHASDWYKHLTKIKPEGMHIIDYSDQLWKLYEDETDTEETKDPISNMDAKQPLNQILYGPPGTGKTYHTIEKAIQIVDPTYYTAWENKENKREKLRERYNELVISDWLDAKGQIAFCTFHQSFTYEDFIEGIKPVEPKDDDEFLRYNIEDGIFKKMVQRATALKEKTAGTFSLSEDEFTQATFYKISLGDINEPEDQAIYDFCIKNNYVSIGYGGSIDFTGKSEEDIYGLLNEKFARQAINLFVNMKKGDYVIVSKGNYSIRAIGKVIGDYEFRGKSEIRHKHFRKVDWLLKDVDVPVLDFYKKILSQQTIYKFHKDFLKREFFVAKSSRQTEDVSSTLNYVIIIDEINRGNISSIFGELITLIEEDKRQGREEYLEVTLPYSKQKFTVPSNLYIIGTMNTADRSVEALDTALRRRFKFEEMPSKPDKLKNIDAVKGMELDKILVKINKRIEKLLDKDHQIGHAYFMNVKDEPSLRDVFKRSIVPLLQEYFYGDPGKIGLVLGEKFVIKSTMLEDFSFAKFEHENAMEFLDRPTYMIETYDNDIDGFIDAIKSI